MLSHIRETTREVLDKLERLWLGRRTKSSWAISISVILILCMCVEEVQLAFDSIAIATLHKIPSSHLSRPALCLRSEESYRDLVDIFHLAYKTRQASAVKGSLGFNPIRNGLLVDEEGGITQRMVDLVNEIKQIMATHGE